MVEETACPLRSGLPGCNPAYPFYFSEPQFLHLQNGEDNNTSWVCSEDYIKHRSLCKAQLQKALEKWRPVSLLRLHYSTVSNLAF